MYLPSLVQSFLGTLYAFHIAYVTIPYEPRTMSYLTFQCEAFVWNQSRPLYDKIAYGYSAKGPASCRRAFVQ